MVTMMIEAPICNYGVNSVLKMCKCLMPSPSRGDSMVTHLGTKPHASSNELWSRPCGPL